MKMLINLLVVCLIIFFPFKVDAMILPIFSDLTMVDKTVIDFEGINSQFDSVQLTNQFQLLGVTFVSDTSTTNYYANLRPESATFMNNSFVDTVCCSGQPDYYFGQKFNFVNPIMAFGLDIQNGSGFRGPLNADAGISFVTSEKEYLITLNAFNQIGSTIGSHIFNLQNSAFQDSTDSFLIDLHFIGLASDAEKIYSAELLYSRVNIPQNNVIGDGYAYDNLRFSEFISDGNNSAIPEPTTIALFGTGLLGAFIRRKFIG